MLDNVIPNVTVEELTKIMLVKNAVWHSNCPNLHDKQKVERAETEEINRQAADDPNPSPVKTRSSILSSSNVADDDDDDDENDDGASEPPCLICNEHGAPRWGACRRAATLGIYTKVLSAATVLRDTALLAKLSVGDMIAIDAVYHLCCLGRLYRRAHSARKGTQDHEDAEQFGALQAFMEV